MANFFSDLPLTLIPNPVTGGIQSAKDETAVKKSLINLIKTPIGSRPFRPDYGTKVYDYIFAPADEETELAINDEIADSINRWEPRAQLTAIESTITDNGIEIKIEYYVTNIPQQQTLETVISRAK
jgi:hypothetical protein